MLYDPAWAYRQYDHQLFLNTVVGPGGDAALLRLKAPGLPAPPGGVRRAVALSTDGNTAIFQVMLEYVLQFRLAFNIGALYMVPAKYADGFDIGGFGGATRFAFNW